jgi:iron complex outermembrane receptor protein
MGYRYKYNSQLNFDISSYYFDYNRLIEFTVGDTFFEATPTPAHLVLPFINENSLEGEVYGVELSAQWQPFKNWRLSGSYTVSQVDLRPTKSNVFIPQSVGGEGDLDAEGEPNHIFNVRSYLNLPYKLEFDTLFYHVSENSTLKIPSYSRVDLRLGWQPTKQIELSLVGQNVLDNSHLELTELLEAATETERSFYFKATYKF